MRSVICGTQEMRRVRTLRWTVESGAAYVTPVAVLLAMAIPSASLGATQSDHDVVEALKRFDTVYQSLPAGGDRSFSTVISRHGLVCIARARDSKGTQHVEVSFRPLDNVLSVSARFSPQQIDGFWWSAAEAGHLGGRPKMELKHALFFSELAEMCEQQIAIPGNAVLILEPAVAAGSSTAWCIVQYDPQGGTKGMLASLNASQGNRSLLAVDDEYSRGTSMPASFMALIEKRASEPEHWSVVALGLEGIAFEASGSQQYLLCWYRSGTFVRERRITNATVAADTVSWVKGIRDNEAYVPKGTDRRQLHVALSVCSPLVWNRRFGYPVDPEIWAIPR